MRVYYNIIVVLKDSGLLGSHIELLNRRLVGVLSINRNSNSNSNSDFLREMCHPSGDKTGASELAYSICMLGFRVGGWV